MPTARELLEQADALMRRNRALPQATTRPAAPLAAEPRATLASSAPVASPRPIQREPITPSIVHTSLPIEEADSEEFIEPVAALARQPRLEGAPAGNGVAPARGEATGIREDPDDADFPVLTDAVGEASSQLGAADDGLPVLTDAVTQIGAVGVDEAARGEPSLWELTSRGEASVLGPAPDSVIVVPAAETLPAVPQAPPQGRDPLGLDQPAPGFVARSGPEVDVPFSSRGAPVTDQTGIDAMPESAGEGAFARGDGLAAQGDARPSQPWPLDGDEPRVFSAVAHLPPEDSEEAAVGAGDPPASAGNPPAFADDSIEPIDVRAPQVENLPGDDLLDADSVRRDDGFASSITDEPVDETPALAAARREVAGLSATPSPAMRASLAQDAPASFDQQRIREIAEEIGMQVLQRIDIFTDTTLRAQLGERLRPVVDRAAADLVSAINEHVGELLRAQVAEAIEREIESWKRDR